MYASGNFTCAFCLIGVDEGTKNKIVESGRKYKVKEFIYPDEKENELGSTEVVLLIDGKRYKSFANYWHYEEEAE